MDWQRFFMSSLVQSPRHTLALIWFPFRRLRLMYVLAMEMSLKAMLANKKKVF